VAPGRAATARWAVPVVLLLLAATGTWLLLAGGDDGDGETAAAPGAGAEATLEVGDTDQASVAELAGLSLPPGTADFLSARLDDDTQLDVTFTLDPAEEAAFLSGSGFDEPVEGQRVILHSSPLWKLNADAPLRGVEDTSEGLRRRVELVAEDGRTRVRMVVTPA
jgi:hypothetical protein